MTADREAIVKLSCQALALLDLCHMTAKRLEDEGHPTGNLANVLQSTAAKFAEVHDHLERGG